MPTPRLRDDAAHGDQGSRQKRLITLLAWFLILAGALILLALDRMPLPMRILVGLVDIFAGLTLLVLVRQRFSKS